LEEELKKLKDDYQGEQLERQVVLVKKKYEGWSVSVDKELDLSNLGMDHRVEQRIILMKKKYEDRLANSDREIYLGKVRMAPQAVAHLVIMLLIVVGNITFFVDRRRQRRNTV
jgi:hypothetical protein